MHDDAPDTPYFAFGSNLDRGTWATFCAERGLDAGLLTPGPAAWLPDHAPAYHYRSRRNRGGALDVVPRLGDAVPGRLFGVRPGGWAALDDKEGHPRRYERVRVWTVDADGRLREATTYRVTAARREHRFVPPTAAYARRVRDGLVSAGHDPARADALARGEAPPPLVRAVFAYGTLKRGEAAAHRLQSLGPREVAPGSIPGALFDLGPYPGLDPGHRGGRVRGELAFFDDPAGALASLDAYEDFLGWGARGNLYHRIVARARTDDGAAHLAWAYALVGRPNAPLVTDGCWTARAG